MANASNNYGKCLPMNIVKYSIPKAKVSCQVMLSLLIRATPHLHLQVLLTS